MSWHTSAILIQEDTPSDFATLLSELGFPGGTPTGTVDFEEATSSFASGKSVAHVDGWTIVCDPMFFFPIDGDIEASPGYSNSQFWSQPLDQALREKSSGGKSVFGFITEGASCTHGFTWHKDGELVRLYLSQSLEIVCDEGEPLPIESDFEEGDDEQNILMMMDKLCVSFASLDGVEFQVFHF